MKNEKELREKQKIKLEEIKKTFPKLKEMHELKEEFRTIYEVSKNGTEAETLNPVIKLYIDKHNTPITSNFKLNRQSSGTSVHS